MVEHTFRSTTLCECNLVRIFVSLMENKNSKLIQFLSVFQSWATVIIEGNDLMNGEIGFVPGSQTATIDEDFSRTGIQCTWLFCYFFFLR